ncbi:MAG: TIGR01777 family protein [Nitrospirae bacterium]|nr:TIGR01777 family protein [Nitrospirota bacterium]
MNILITGGGGFIGKPLSRELLNSGHNVIVTTRRQITPKDNANPPSPPFSKGGMGGFLEMLTWNPPTLIPPEIMSSIDAVINLAGESIASGRWTKRRKGLILSSRINTTLALVQSMKQIPLYPPLSKGDGGRLPKVLISASAIGYYGPCGDEFVTEDTPPGTDFLAEVCKAWEAEALKAEESGVRVVLLRLGAVLESDGGALPKIALPFKFFLGGPIGNGKQWFSWVHRDDVLGIIKFSLENDSISGPVNITAPNPVRNKEFCTSLGNAIHRPSWLPVPAWIVKLTLGELGDVLLEGQRVAPEKTMKEGYKFKYPELNEALRAIFEPE